MELKTELIEVDSKTYGELIKKNSPVFCSADFLELNSHKVDKVHFFILKDGKMRLAFALGEKDHIWMAPFSAPFSIPIELKNCVELEYYYELFTSLVDYVKKNNGIRIEYYSQPDIYGARQNSKASNALLGCGFKIEYQEVNYSLHICKAKDFRYENLLHHNAKKNLKAAIKSELTFRKCIDLNDKKRAYDIIKENRLGNGYSLSMSWEEILATIKIVDNDFFIVSRGNQDIASAIIFYVTDEVVQVVYWGDIPGQSKYRPINFLAYKLVENYINTNIKIIDIGPSAPMGKPNFGLCSFKESIGCSMSSKYRYIYEVN